MRLYKLSCIILIAMSILFQNYIWGDTRVTSVPVLSVAPNSNTSLPYASGTNIPMRLENPHRYDAIVRHAINNALSSDSVSLPALDRYGGHETYHYSPR